MINFAGTKILITHLDSIIQFPVVTELQKSENKITSYEI